MNFAEELKMVRENKLEEYAIEFAEEINPKLLESAAEGFTGYEIKLEDREDAHILRNSEFRKHLELLLEGCEVRIDEKEFTNLLFKNKYYRSYLVISWK